MAVIFPILSTFDAAGVNKAQRAFKGLSGTTKTAAIAFGALGIAVGKFGFDAVKAAAEDQKAQLKLAKTLENVTGATDAQTAAVEKFITAQQFATGVSDSQLRPALENLVRATGDVTKAQGLLKLGLDVSAGSQRDLETISLAFSKALGGNFAGLSKLGIVIPENIKKTKDFSKVQEYLNKLFGGQAAVAAGTFEGKLAILRQRLQEAQETIGGLLLPILTKLVDYFLKNVMPAIEAVVRAIQFEGAGAGLQLVITNIATVVTNLEGTAKKIKEVILLFLGIKTVYPLIAGLATQWGVVSTAIGVTATTTQIATGVMKRALISTGIGALIVAAGFLVAKIYDIAIAGQSAEADITISSGKIGGRFGYMAQQAHAVVVKMDEISVAARHAMDAVENARLGINTKTETSGYVPPAYVPPPVGGGGLTKAEKDAAKAAEDAAKAAAAMAKIIGIAARDSKRALDKMNYALTTAKDKLQEAKDAFNDYADSVKESIISQFSFTSALSAFTDGKKNAADAAKNLADAEIKFQKALDSKDIDAVTDSLRELRTAQTENEKASTNKKSFLQILKEQAASATAFAGKVQTLMSMGLTQGGIDQVIAAGAEAGGAIADELIAGGVGVIKKTNSLLTSVENAAKILGESAADKFYQAGVTNGQALVNGVIAAVTAAGFRISAGAVALPSALQRAINKGSLSPAQVKELNSLLSGVPALANGGVVNKPTLAMIGEAGPEAVIPLSGRNAGMGNTINITVNAGMGANGSQIGKDIVNEIKKYERTNGPVFKSA